MLIHNTQPDGNTQPRWQPTTAGDAVVTATVTALNKMPTCCVVDCENRTSSGVKFFRIPAESHPFQKNRRHL